MGIDDEPRDPHKEIHEAYAEVVSSGRLRDQDVRRYWLLGNACSSCNVCAAIREFAKGGIGVFDLYRFDDQSTLLPPAHDGCDCQERYVADLTYVTESPFKRY